MGFMGNVRCSGDLYHTRAGDIKHNSGDLYHTRSGDIKHNSDDLYHTLPDEIKHNSWGPYIIACTTNVSHYVISAPLW